MPLRKSAFLFRKCVLVRPFHTYTLGMLSKKHVNFCQGLDFLNGNRRENDEKRSTLQETIKTHNIDKKSRNGDSNFLL